MNRKVLIVLLTAVLITGCQSSAEGQEVEGVGTQSQSQTVQSSETESQETESEVISSSMVTTSTFLMESDTNGVEKEHLDEYTIYAELDVENKSLDCLQTVVYKNKEEVILEEVILQVLPNAYRSIDTAPILFGDVDSIYPNGFSPGFIDFSSVQLNGKTTDYEIYGADKTLMKINLVEPIKPGESVELGLSYVVQIPPAYDRFGYNDSTFNIANWYPVAAVYDDNQWNEDGYLPIGDPFYTDMGIYNITYNVPENYEVASTGARVDEFIENGRKTMIYQADYVRDAAWLTSDAWNVHVEDVEGTMIRSYYFGEFSFPEQKAVDSARESIEIFNEIFGPYPYSELSVVATDFPSGMEYPTIVMIAKDRYKASRINALESVIAHEIGHQWWYGVVGNDQIDEAWLDESLTVFSTAMYYGERYGDDAYESYVNSYRNTYEKRKSQDGDGVVIKPLTEFESWTDYSNLVYRKGMLFIDALRTEYGEQEVLDFMKKYYETYKFRTAKTKYFIDMGRDHFGDSFDEFANEWLYNEVREN